MDIRINALCARYKRALAANSTYDGGLDSLPETLASQIEPQADWYDLCPNENVGHGAVMVVPFAEGGQNTPFSMLIVGYRAIGAGNKVVWVASELYAADCVAGEDHGFAGRDVTDAEFFCDTITPTFSNENVSCETRSPANNRNCHIAIDTKGFRYIKFFFNNTTSTAANALLAPF